MGQETAIYLTNIVIAALLAGLLTRHWQREGRSEAMHYWMLSAWILVAADILFAGRPGLPDAIGRILPTVLVSIGHAGLYFGARKTGGFSLQFWVVALAVALHAVGLIWFYAAAPHSEWRKVFNGLVWAGFSLASYRCMLRSHEVYWESIFAPARVFLVHGLFHCGRLLVASWFAVMGWEEASGWLQTIGDLEVSFFMVALFTGILLAHLQLRNEDLTRALGQVKTLTGLLPICAWCKKVRDDDGYWQQVDDYFAARGGVEFTHGICTDCFDKQTARGPSA